VLRVLAYRWPVHRLAPRHKPVEPPGSPPSSWLSGCRHQVRFTLINSGHGPAAEPVSGKPRFTGLEAIAALESERCPCRPAGVAGPWRGIAGRFSPQGAILGTLA
jgi:hypothetical protein